MTYIEAIKEVLDNNKMVQRKMYDLMDYDHKDPQTGGYTGLPWSQWMRIRMEDDHIETDALLFFESRNYDDVSKKWLEEWGEDNLSKADVLANDWEITEE